MKIRRVKSNSEIEQVRQLFHEYEMMLGLDLGFQSFEEELMQLPGKYSPPEGALFIAVKDAEMAGCVALRKLEDDVCEMKRLFVRSRHRKCRIGAMLAEEIIHEAIRIGYKLMRLDTLDRLKEAMKLYESLGFKQIDSYCYNPLPDVVYWEKSLTKCPKINGIQSF